jgi:uncharacterized protein involved in exopolysaccharide biosynthesis
MSLEAPADDRDIESNPLEYWRVLSKRKLLVFGLPLVLAFVTGVYNYFIATKIYESTASILAPRESGGGGAGMAAALAASGAGQFIGGLIPTTGTSRDTFMAILKSQTMAGELLDRFKLQEYYGSKYRSAAIDALQSATQLSVSREGVISIKVEDKDPKLAADIANAYVAHLDRLFVKMGTSEGTKQRAFIADRMEKTEKGLRQAEEALRRFQERNKAVVLTEQSKGAIDVAAKVRAEIAAAEVQLESLRTYATENNPIVAQQRSRLQELKRQLGQMQYGKLDLPGDAAARDLPRQEFHVPFPRVPELSMELVRLSRDVKVQEALFTLLTQQYEQAKIQEAKDAPTVQILDRAVPAERKAKPKTLQSMIVAGIVSLFIAILLAFFCEYRDRSRNRRRIAVA